MPIYEYRCRACARDFETYVATAKSAVACPACASDNVMRKLSVFGLKSGDSGSVTSMPVGGGGGCCGGGCSCH